MSEFYHTPQEPFEVPRTSGVYRIINTANGKIYIGSSIDLSTRWRKHRYDLRSNKHPNRKLQNSWNKHSESMFRFEIIELILPMFLLEREQYWLDKLHPEYNIAISAKAPNLGLKASPETRAKMSIANLGNKRNLGKKRSPESIEKTRLANLGKKRSPEVLAKMKIALTGRKLSDETRQKMSVSHKGLSQSEATREKMRNRVFTAETRARMSVSFTGRKHSPETIEKIRLKKKNVSPETRAKISESKKGKPAPNRGKPHTTETRAKISAARRKSLVVTSPDGVEQKIYGIRPFCEVHGLSISCLMNVANGKAKHHKGWKARFPDETSIA